ncbi:MAG: DUF3656 domain-containing protein [Candidatus Auribacterota bacterium]
MAELRSRTIELLAPAKDIACGIRAIDCGADAVYIGAEQFGARKAAGNSLEDISRLIEYAHHYFAKVYVTVNTILTDDELPEAVSLIHRLYEIGADAIMVQDMGLLEADLPPVPLLASTQTNNTTPQKIKFLEDAGFRRAVLARELSIEEIRAIREQTSIELECFVQGSLCVSYSGQCYLSYAIGGRSGNRGECAQPCRKLYSLVDSEEKTIIDKRYLLSLRDLNLSEYIEELIDAGVSSFKIEGRLRDEAYVANIVPYYRNKLDEALARKQLRKASSGRATIDFTPDLLKTFNRGYCDYFLHGRTDTIVSPHTPKSTGEPLGTVTRTGKDYFVLDVTHDIHNGDGICFFDAEHHLQGTNINRVDGGRIYPSSMKAICTGLFIYRNYDHEFVKHIQKADIIRTIDVVFTVRGDDEKLLVHARDEDGIEVSGEYPVSGDTAKNRDMMLDTIRKQFSRLGDTKFRCAGISVDLERVVFIPVKDINQMRRDITDKLWRQRLNSYVRQKSVIQRNNVPYPEKSLGYEANVLNKKAAAFYKRHGVEDIQPAMESGLDSAGKKVMTTRYCILHQYGICRKAGKTGTEYKPPFYLVDETGKKYKINCDCKKCVMELYF